MKKLAFIIQIVALCFSCSNSGDTVVIPLAKQIDKSAEKEDCGSIVKGYRIIPLETSESTLLSDDDNPLILEIIL